MSHRRGLLQVCRLALSALCAGPNSHDLKIHLTDIRNQDDTVRKTGDATFRLCDHIAVTGGRDDPRILDQGSAATTAKIVGKFVYTDASEDPLLYAECNVGLYVDPTTGNSLKDTSWVCWYTIRGDGRAGHRRARRNPARSVYPTTRKRSPTAQKCSTARLPPQLERSRRDGRECQQPDHDKQLRQRLRYQQTD